MLVNLFEFYDDAWTYGHQIKYLYLLSAQILCVFSVACSEHTVTLHHKKTELKTCNVHRGHYCTRMIAWQTKTDDQH